MDSKRRIGQDCNSVFKTPAESRNTCCASYTSNEAKLRIILLPGYNITSVKSSTSIGDAYPLLL